MTYVSTTISGIAQSTVAMVLWCVSGSKTCVWHMKGERFYNVGPVSECQLRVTCDVAVATGVESFGFPCR